MTAQTQPVNILLWKNKIWESRVSNTGDLAIIRNTVLKLKAQIPDAVIHLIADDPDYARAHYGVIAHPVATLWNPVALIQLLRSIDLVILGGGTVLQDDYFAGIIPINLSVPALAKLLGKRTVCNAIGVGSEDEVSAFGKLLCRLAVPRFDSISVRDPESRQMVERWAPGHAGIHLTTDIAVDLPPADFEAIRPALVEDGVDLGARPTVAIAARKIFHHDRTWLYFLPSSLRQRLGLQGRLHRQRLEEFKDTLARFCDHVIERYDAQVVFTPFYSSGGGLDSSDRETPRRLFTSGDNRFADDVAARVASERHVHVLRRNYGPEEMLCIIGRCQAMVGVPYHSVVFSSSQNVPVVGIHYVSKVARYMRILGLEDFVVHAELETGVSLSDLTDRFDRLWAERDALVARLAERNQTLRRLSDENIRLIREAIHAG